MYCLDLLSLCLVNIELLLFLLFWLVFRRSGASEAEPYHLVLVAHIYREWHWCTMELLTNHQQNWCKESNCYNKIYLQWFQEESGLGSLEEPYKRHQQSKRLQISERKEDFAINHPVWEIKSCFEKDLASCNWLVCLICTIVPQRKRLF